MLDAASLPASATRSWRWSILLAFAAVYLIWGSTYLAIRFAIETVPPFLVGAARFLVAGGLLYGWARIRGQETPTRANWGAATLMGGLLLLGGNGGVLWAEQRVSSGLAALLVTMVPLWVVLLEWLGPRPLRRGRPGRAVLLGVAGGFLGVALLAGPVDLEGGAVDLVGAAVLVGASLSWASGSVLSRHLTLPSSPLLGTAMQMLGGGALLLLAGLATGEPARLSLEQVSATSLLALAYLTVFGSLVAFSAYVFLLREIPTSKVATYAYVNPVVALALGWTLAGEELSARTLMAAAIILGSVVLITTYRRPANGAAEATKSTEPIAAQPQLATASPGRSLMEVPTELVPLIRRLLARHGYDDDCGRDSPCCP
jgi:drug/metabolite transporter (DMT)-like permease